MLRTSERIQELEATLRGMKRILSSVSMTGQQLCLERDNLIVLLRKYEWTAIVGGHCMGCSNYESNGHD